MTRKLIVQYYKDGQIVEEDNHTTPNTIEVFRQWGDYKKEECNFDGYVVIDGDERYEYF